MTPAAHTALAVPSLALFALALALTASTKAPVPRHADAAVAAVAAHPR